MVNGVDVVPRMLGMALDGIMSFVYRALWVFAAIVKFQSYGVPERDAKILEWESKHILWVQNALRSEGMRQQRTSYLPLGMYHVMLGDQLQTVDTASQAGLTKLALWTAVHRAAGILPPLQYAAECSSAHLMGAYRSSLARVFRSGATEGKARTFRLGLVEPLQGSKPGSTRALPDAQSPGAGEVL